MFNDNKCISCTIPKLFKLRCDTVYKNHNHSPNNLSQDYRHANKFMIILQNIRGISNKFHEFVISLSPNAPQVTCLTEHHLQTKEIGNVNFGQYTL